MPLVEPPVPVLILPFRGGEITCCHLDGYGSERNALLDRMELVQSYLWGRPKTARMRVWLNLDDTHLDRALDDRIIEMLYVAMPRIVRIAFIGVAPRKRGFDARVRRWFSADPGALVRGYFRDAERAKEWLV